MKIKSYKKAFTLIELLVVITIIGILATGATTIYTSQIQKARDSTRLTDVKALQTWIEQVYQDNSEYPHTDLLVRWWPWITWLLTYVEKLPADPKHGQPCNYWWIEWNQTDCWYAYIVSADANGILYWRYEVSTAFEAEWNVDKQAALDWWWTWPETSRLEIWIGISKISTAVALDSIATGKHTWSCTVGGLKQTVDSDVVVVINWNPTTDWNECD